MRNQVQFPGRVFEERQQAAEWQCRLQVVEATAEAEKAKAMMAFQNAQFAAAFCRRENGRCEGCGE